MLEVDGKAAVAAKSRDAGLGSSEKPVKEQRSMEKVTPFSAAPRRQALRLGEAFPRESIKSQALGIKMAVAESRHDGMTSLPHLQHHDV